MVEVVKVSVGFELADLFPSFSFLAKISPSRCKYERLKQGIERIIDNVIKSIKRANQQRKVVKEVQRKISWMFFKSFITRVNVGFP